MSKHTPEPWVLEDGRVVGAELPWRSSGYIWSPIYGDGHPGKLICRVDCDELAAHHPPEKIEEFEANAARIVACVNACAGIGDPGSVPVLVDALREISRHSRCEDYSREELISIIRNTEKIAATALTRAEGRK